MFAHFVQCESEIVVSNRRFGIRLDRSCKVPRSDIPMPLLVMPDPLIVLHSCLGTRRRKERSIWGGTSFLRPATCLV